MTAVQRVAVIGGGIAGPVVATALQRAGISATVYEAYPESSGGIGSSLALAPNGLAALGIIGADQEVVRRALPITSSRLSVGGHLVGETPRLTDLPPQQMIGRADLHQILHAAATSSGVRFEHGRRMVAVHEQTHGVRVDFSDGGSAEADIAIGADGVRSGLRTIIDPNAPGAGYTGLLSLAATIDAADLPAELVPPPGTMTFAFGRRAYYLYWTNADGSITWGANLPSPHYLSFSDARTAPPLEWLGRLRTTYAGDVPGELLAGRTTEENLEVQGAIHIMPPVPHWHRGRMVLTGDAVHCPSNSTGQGASLAIESAIELARCLRDLGDPQSAFAAYTTLRRDRVERITRRGARLNGSKAPNTLAQKMMRVMMPIMNKCMNAEKEFGPEQRFTIDWDAAVTSA